MSSGVEGSSAMAAGATASSRFDRMARLRNAGLTRLRAAAFFGAEFLIVADSDLALGWDVDGIAHPFGLPARARGGGAEGPPGGRPGGAAVPEPYWEHLRRHGLPWTAVCSNGRVGREGGYHYDSIAFRNALLGRGNFRHHERLAHGRLGPPEVVQSCFGGLAVYNISAIGDCGYSGEAYIITIAILLLFLCIYIYTYIYLYIYIY